jgi:hypothetical protein
MVLSKFSQWNEGVSGLAHDSRDVESFSLLLGLQVTFDGFPWFLEHRRHQAICRLCMEATNWGAVSVWSDFVAITTGGGSLSQLLLLMLMCLQLVVIERCYSSCCLATVRTALGGVPKPAAASVVSGADWLALHNI